VRFHVHILSKTFSKEEKTMQDKILFAAGLVALFIGLFIGIRSDNVSKKIENDLAAANRHVVSLEQQVQTEQNRNTTLGQRLEQAEKKLVVSEKQLAVSKSWFGKLQASNRSLVEDMYNVRLALEEVLTEMPAPEQSAPAAQLQDLAGLLDEHHAAAEGEEATAAEQEGKPATEQATEEPSETVGKKEEAAAGQKEEIKPSSRPEAKEAEETAGMESGAKGQQDQGKIEEPPAVNQTRQEQASELSDAKVDEGKGKGKTESGSTVEQEKPATSQPAEKPSGQEHQEQGSVKLHL
jgi:hypothetical protein